MTTKPQPTTYEQQAAADADSYIKWQRAEAAQEKATKLWREATAAQQEARQLWREAHEAEYKASQGTYYEELKPLRDLANQAADNTSAARIENDKAQAAAHAETHNAANI